MNQEKMKTMVKLLEADVERAKRIFSMSPNEAAEEFTKLGCEVSEQEMLELGKELTALLQKLSDKGELDVEMLENISGGGLHEFGCGMFIGVCIVAVAAASIPW